MLWWSTRCWGIGVCGGWVGLGPGALFARSWAGCLGGGLVGLGGARRVDMLLRVFWLLLPGFNFWNGGLALGCASTQI